MEKLCLSRKACVKTIIVFISNAIMAKNKACFRVDVRAIFVRSYLKHLFFALMWRNACLSC